MSLHYRSFKYFNALKASFLCDVERPTLCILSADDVIVTGVLTAKWSPDLKDVRCDLEPVLVANYVRYCVAFFLQSDFKENFFVLFIERLIVLCIYTKTGNTKLYNHER